jgi:hypothetical protein
LGKLISYDELLDLGREIAPLTRFGPVPVYSTLAGGPPVGYWVSTTISTVLDVLKILTVEEEDEDNLLLMPDQLAGESLSFFATEVIATDISNTFPNIVVLLEGLHQVRLSLHVIPHRFKSYT